jgi:hypothetical protein
VIEVAMDENGTELKKLLSENEPNFAEIAEIAHEKLYDLNSTDSSAVQDFSAANPKLDAMNMNRRAFFAKLSWGIAIAGGSVGVVLSASKDSLIAKLPLFRGLFPTEIPIYLIEEVMSKRRRPEFEEVISRYGPETEIGNILRLIKKFDAKHIFQNSEINPLRVHLKSLLLDDPTRAFLSDFLASVETRNQVSPDTIALLSRSFSGIPDVLQYSILEKRISALAATVKKGDEKKSNLWNYDLAISEYNALIGKPFGAAIVPGSAPQLIGGSMLATSDVLYEFLRVTLVPGFYAHLHMAHYVAAGESLDDRDRAQVWEYLWQHLSLAAKLSSERQMFFEGAIWNACSLLALQAWRFGNAFWSEKFLSACLPSDREFWPNPGSINADVLGRAQRLDNMVVAFAIALFASANPMYRSVWGSSSNPLGIPALHRQLHGVRQTEYAHKISEASKVIGLEPTQAQDLMANYVNDDTYALHTASLSDVRNADWSNHQ